MRNRKVLKQIFVVLAVVVILGMLILTILPLFYAL